MVLRSLRDGLRDDAWIYITAPNDYQRTEFSENHESHHLRKYTKLEFLNATSLILGNPTNSGEAHGFLGLSMIKDSVISENHEAMPVLACISSSVSNLSSNDSIFYFAIWGNEIAAQSVIGSPAPTEIYSSISNAMEIDRHVSELNALDNRELAYKLQTTSEALTETQNQLRAVRILMKSLNDKGDISDNADSLFSGLVGLSTKESKFKKMINNPPPLVQKVYGLLPNTARDYLRNLRRRILR
jgi:hypothetical protein